MKKRAVPLFLAVLTACALACPAMAAEAPSPETTPSVLYPVEVLEYTEGDRAEPRISKTYELSPMDDPALIPTGDFERSGCLYTLLDIVKEDQTETDSKYYTETVTLDSKSKDMEEIMPLLAATCEAVTEDGYLSINGSVRKQIYTYFLYEANDGTQKESPAYCVNPNQYGVPQTVGPGESIKYLAEERASDPKVVGIISNGYPHRSLGELKLDNKYQAYYATKMALWCYLMPDWNIANLKVAPGLSGSELDIGNRILAAAKDIYKRGTTYNYMLSPRMTVTADKSTAYPVTIGGGEYKQQVFTVWSETWVYDYDVSVAFSNPDEVPEGTKIVDMNNNEITAVTTEGTSDGYAGQFKVLYPVGSIQGQSGNVQLSLSASVAQYAAMYAVCLEKDRYGNLQNYICDLDNNRQMELAAISSYADSTEDVPGETLLKIVKLEEGTETPLEGAVFSVVDPEGRKVGSFSSDENGEVLIPLTLEGHYTVTEDIKPF